MNTVDGTRSWEEVEPFFEAAFHPDATFETADGTLNRSEWKEIARGLVERGAVISGFELRTTDGKTAAYRLTLAVGDDAPLELAATGRFVDDLVIHVAPADPASYSELVARSG
jgi:hypothetical protein